MDYTVNDAWDFVIPIFGTIILFFLIYVFILEIWAPFWDQRNYIKTEIDRSIGEERKYWKRKLRHFYLRQIPVIGLFFRKKRR